MTVQKMCVTFLATLLLAASCYGSETVVPANLAINKLIGTKFYPVTSSSGKSYCDYQSIVRGRHMAVAFHHLDADGQWRWQNIANDIDMGGEYFVLGYGLACTDDTIWFTTYDPSTFNITVWSAGTTSGSAAPLLLPGSILNTDSGKFRYEGDAIKLLVRNKHLLLVSYTNTDAVAVEFIPGLTNHLAANLGSRYILDACTTADSVYSVDGDNGNFERFSSSSSQTLEVVSDLGYSPSGTPINHTWALTCDIRNGYLPFHQNGGLTINISSLTASSHVVLGNSIAGYRPGDLEQLEIGLDGTIYFVMSIASPSNIAEDAVFKIGNNISNLVYTPPNPTALGLLNLSTGMAVYENGNVTKSQ